MNPSSTWAGSAAGCPILGVGELPALVDRRHHLVGARDRDHVPRARDHDEARVVHLVVQPVAVVLRGGDPVAVADDDHDRRRDLRIVRGERAGVAHRRGEVLGARPAVPRPLAAGVEQRVGGLGVGHRLGGEAGADVRLVGRVSRRAGAAPATPRRSRAGSRGRADRCGAPRRPRSRAGSGGRARRSRCRARARTPARGSRSTNGRR